MKRQQFTRRQLLMGIGALGGASCICGAGGLTGLLLALRHTATPQTSTAPQPIIINEARSASATPQRPAIVPRVAWGGLPPDHRARSERGFYSETNPTGWRIYEGELADHYQSVVVHHSVIYESDDDSTMLEIQQFHRETRGWADVAYHFLVGKGGTIYEGRDWAVRGAHVGGYNTGSLGICLLGNFTEEQPTDAQINNTRQLINWLATRLQLTHLATHRDFNPQTECPGDNVFNMSASFATSANLAYGTEGYIAPDQTLRADCDCCHCEAPEV